MARCPRPWSSRSFATLTRGGRARGGAEPQRGQCRHVPAALPGRAWPGLFVLASRPTSWPSSSSWLYAGAVIALFLFYSSCSWMCAGFLRRRRPTGRSSAWIRKHAWPWLIMGAGVVNFMALSGGEVGLPGGLPGGAGLKAYAEHLFTVYLLPVQVLRFSSPHFHAGGDRPQPAGLPPRS